jgi:Mrp family chromosome partitioning ATPase
MLGLAVLTQNANTAHSIGLMVQQAGGFKLVFNGSPVPAHVAIRTLYIHRPELALLDLSDWGAVSKLAHELKEEIGTAVVGFRSDWNRSEQLTFEEAGIRDLVRDPFSFGEMETAAFEALHRDRPVLNENILAFLPAKAGGGSSTVALNTAAALVHGQGKKVLLIESDRRSGVLSILLNLEDRAGLREALEHAGGMSTIEWQQTRAEVAGIHLLLASPGRRGPLPSWGDYYQLLFSLQKEYDFIVVDMPEVVNDATAEIVRSARGVFIVCEPELPSLRLAKYRCAELESCGMSREDIHVVVNRWERGRVRIEDVEAATGRPVFATIPNDYSHVKNAVLQSRLVHSSSPFAKGCDALARKLGGLPATTGERLKFALLRSLGRDSR